MNLRFQMMKSKRGLLVLLAAGVLAISAAGVQALPEYASGPDAPLKIACSEPGPCDDSGGGGG